MLQLWVNDFLDVVDNTVSLKDPDAMREFCMNWTESEKNAHTPYEEVCTRCKPVWQDENYLLIVKVKRFNSKQWMAVSCIITPNLQILAPCPKSHVTTEIQY